MSETSQEGLKTRVETVGPEEAKELLKGATNYRRLRTSWIDNLARVIARGEWKLNGESIKIDARGKLIDGQHRLQAVIRSGRPIETLVVRGVKTDAEIDTGRSRCLADLLGSRGEKHASSLAATVTLYIRWKQGTGVGSNDYKVSTTQAVNFLKLNPGIRNSVQIGTEMKELTAPSIVATVHYAACAGGAEGGAGVFFESLKTGVGLGRSDPRRLLRERLLADRSARGAKLRKSFLMALVIKAWNLWVRGESRPLLRWGMNEEFPEMDVDSAAEREPQNDLAAKGAGRR